MLSWLIFILGATLAGFVQGLTGFAFALVVMSFWVWILPPQLTAPWVVFASLWCHIIALRHEQHNQFDRSMIYVYIVGGLIGVPLGTLLLHVVNAEIFKIILGVFLVIWCPIMFLAPKFTSIVRFGKIADGMIGFLGGILGGLGGFCGALPSCWVMLKQLPKQQQRYILRHFNFAIQLFTLLIYIKQGAFSQQHLHYLIVLIACVSLPALLGAQLFYRISEQRFNHLVLSLLFMAGWLMLFNALILHAY